MKNTHAKDDHGTMATYVVGFVLSLLLTAGAYVAVTNKLLSGKVLLAAILVLAVVQMCVQILFFLHLGRGPKPLYNVVFFAGTVGLILVVVIGSIFIMDNLHYNMSPSEVVKKLAQDESISEVNGEKTGACTETFTNHKITISKGKASPLSVKAKLCDTITFVNEDPELRDVAFGPHQAHQNYGGESEVALRTAYPKTVTLNQTGSFSYHDDLDLSMTGSFTVSN